MLVSIDVDPRFKSVDLGSIAGIHDDVAVQSGYPRKVVNLEQIMGGPNDEDVLMLLFCDPAALLPESWVPQRARPVDAKPRIGKKTCSC